jgi:hypothetical protein
MDAYSHDKPIRAAARTAVTAEPLPDRAVHVGTFKKEAAADWLFAAVILVTTWWYLRVSSGQSFARDDWRIASRSLSFGDLFEPLNGHLSIVPLAIYRVLLGEFGLETYIPYRLLGITSLLCLGAALFLFARSRVGAPVALVVAVSVLWLPTLHLAPILANYHIPLVCAVVCAAAMPSVELRSDITVGVALALALATSNIGVAVAAACAVHAVMFRPRARRWVAVAVPSLLWVLWWRTLGNQPRPPNSLSFPSALEAVARGVARSFAALTGGWWVGGAVLLVAWVILFVHRVRTDRASAVTQLAWMAGVVAWWGGLAWSRPELVARPDQSRYAYVGGVLILLSALPAFPVGWIRTARAQWLMAAPALVITGIIVLVNHDGLRNAALNKAAQGARAEIALYELEQVDPLEPIEPTRRLIPELARITVRDYETVVARYGSIDLEQAPDEALIERHAVRAPIVGPPPPNDPPCAAGPVTLWLGDEVGLHTRDEPAMVRARRLGSSMVDVKRIPAHRSAVVRFVGPTVIEDLPWVIEAPGACIHED